MKIWGRGWQGVGSQLPVYKVYAVSILFKILSTSVCVCIYKYFLCIYAHIYKYFWNYDLKLFEHLFSPFDSLYFKFSP